LRNFEKWVDYFVYHKKVELEKIEMNFQIELNQADNPIIEVTQVIQLVDYVLESKFSDGKTTRVEFKKFLEAASHPEIRKYLDSKNFSEFELKDGNVIWNDYELIFPISDLYSGEIG
jgi:hypothetical protein